MAQSGTLGVYCCQLIGGACNEWFNIYLSTSSDAEAVGGS